MQSKLLASEGNCLSGIAYIRIRSRNEIFLFLSPLHNHHFLPLFVARLLRAE